MCRVMYRIAYMNMKREHMFEPCPADYLMFESVTPANVSLGRRVRQGQVWNRTWREDGSDRGTIIGYTDDNGTLAGQNIEKCYNQVQNGEKHWCVVRWDNGRTRIYPIGAQGVHALIYNDWCPLDEINE